jgi:hypothetical protein
MNYIYSQLHTRCNRKKVSAVSSYQHSQISHVAFGSGKLEANFLIIKPRASPITTIGNQEEKYIQRIRNKLKVQNRF